MKIKDILSENECCISFEFFPPRDESAFSRFLGEFGFYLGLKPSFVSVTYGAGGSTKEKTFALATAIKKKYNLAVMPHLTSLTHSPEEVENILFSYSEAGIENILALRGDIPKDVRDFDISSAYFKNALALIRFIKEKFDDSFCIGVSAYPEGYPGYKNLEKEVEYLKQKFEGGGSFAITQMFFDNSRFYNFVDMCRRKGIAGEIIPGIMPITNFSQIFSFAQNVGAEIPKNIVDRFSGVLDSPEDMEKIGLEVAVSQINGLLRNGFRKIHLFTLNRRSIIEKIVLAIRGWGS